jgi:hypothetical protein
MTTNQSSDMKIKAEVYYIVKWLQNAYNLPIQRSKSKIFCLSMQRNGTTSFGNFLEDHGVRTARDGYARRAGWGALIDGGDYSAVFNSLAFKSFQGFEDGPWWGPNMYRVLENRFKTAKFVLLHRDSDDWFRSMISHSRGKTLGNTYRHCRTYRRLPEFYAMLNETSDFDWINNGIDNLMTIDLTHRDHYVSIYEEHNESIVRFFSKYAPERLYHSHIDNMSKWAEIGDFLGLDIKGGYESHANLSKRS